MVKTNVMIGDDARQGYLQGMIQACEMLCISFQEVTEALRKVYHFMPDWETDLVASLNRIARKERARRRYERMMERGRRRRK